MTSLIGMADLVTRARTPVERDYQGTPAWAHALEMPTRFAKQLVQIVRGGLVLGLDPETAMGVAARCCHDSMPPLRRMVLADVAANPLSGTAKVVASTSAAIDDGGPHAAGAPLARLSRRRRGALRTEQGPVDLQARGWRRPGRAREFTRVVSKGQESAP